MGRIPGVAHEPARQARSDAAGAADERALTPDEFNAAVVAVTNAFGDPTRREIYLAVRDAPRGSRPPTWPSGSRCTRTWPVTTWRS